jgi:hypothetical protein
MRIAFCLAACLFVSTAHAAPIKIGEPQPADTLRIEAEFVDVTKPSGWSVKSPTGPNPFLNDGWQNFGLFDLVNTNPNGAPPVWEFVNDLFIDRTEAEFWWRPYFGIVEYAIIDVAEFVAAGDTTLTMLVDSEEWGLGDFHVITFNSPNLGTVTRTYERGTTIPEPASAALLALGAVLVLRRPRQ